MDRIAFVSRSSDSPWLSVYHSTNKIIFQIKSYSGYNTSKIARPNSSTSPQLTQRSSGSLSLESILDELSAQSPKLFRQFIALRQLTRRRDRSDRGKIRSPKSHRRSSVNERRTKDDRERTEVSSNRPQAT